MVTAKKIGKLEYLTADGIPVPHAFTTRLGGVSEGIFDSLNIAMHRGDSAENVAHNHAILARALGYDVNCTVLAHQTHSDIVRAVTRADCAGLNHHAYPECDALITCDAGVALVIFTADCTPILFYDPVTGTVGAAHAGWRGTVAGIAAKTVEAMVREFGCKASDIRAAIGPNIGACCFETNRDVPDAVRAACGAEAEEHIRAVDDKYYVNLKEINALFLRRAGVLQIEQSTACTVCEHDRFWSHRYTHGERGSQGAVIVCKEGRV